MAFKVVARAVGPAVVSNARRQLRQHAPAVAAWQPTRFLSTPVEQTDEERERAEIQAGMDQQLAALEKTNEQGYLALQPWEPCTLPANREETERLDPLPETVKHRTVTISQGDKDTMTGGMGKTYGWTLKFNSGADRWTNPMTGWSATGDPVSTVNLTFDTKEQAIMFAEKRGLKYDVKERPKRIREFGTNYYAHNFLDQEQEAILREEGKATDYFNNAKSGASHYFRPLKYHGDGTVKQHGDEVASSKGQPAKKQAASKGQPAKKK